MNNGGNNFIERLLATFRIEAEEHLQVISDGLLELERCPSDERPGIVETVFREAHSLKGAARAVNMTDVEMICQALETVFAALKRKRVGPTPEMLDVLHQANDGIRQLLASDENGAANEIPSLVRKLQLESNAQPTAEVHPELPELDPRDSVTVPDSAPDDVAARTVEQAAVDSIEPANRMTQSGKERSRAAETVRISTARLGSLLLQSEEMVSAKLAMTQVTTELIDVGSMLETWKKQWARISPEARNVRYALEEKARRNQHPKGDIHTTRLLEFLDWNRGQMKALETKTAELATLVDRESRSLGGMVDNLLEDMKKVLMLPFSSLLDGFPKLVRDLSRDQGKDIELVVKGADIEIDRRILEELKDPLIHIVRNCIDHGVERPDERQRRKKPARATITIAISQAGGNKVEILVSDDGAGIDLSRVKHAAVARGLLDQHEAARLEEQDALALIFQSEISTSAMITDLSGRGLGLAIVREKAEKLGGDVSVGTTIGLGTTFRILLPLTLATFRGILVAAAGRSFVVPTASVERVTRLKKSDVTTVEGKETIVSDGRVVSLVRLEDVLELPSVETGDEPAEFTPVLILGAGEKRVALGVDAVLNEQEVLVKSLGKNLKRVRNVAAATVLGSGEVVPILSVPDLLKSAVRTSFAARRPAAERNGASTKVKSILVAEDSITSRMLLKNILEAAGYQVRTAVDGLDAFAALRSEDFDLVVSDVEMPGMNGLDLTAKIRSDKTLAELPVVLVTSLGSREHRERGIDVGANAYIVKSSFDQSNLLDVIRRLV